MNNFGTWLLGELEKRDMSQADLSRASHITTAQISRIISGSRSPGKNALTEIAYALHLPPDLVFRKAGILPPKPQADELIEQIMHEATQLPKQDQEELLAFIRMKRNLREKT